MDSGCCTGCLSRVLVRVLSDSVCQWGAVFNMTAGNTFSNKLVRCCGCFAVAVHIINTYTRTLAENARNKVGCSKINHILAYLGIGASSAQERISMDLQEVLQCLGTSSKIAGAL